MRIEVLILSLVVAIFAFQLVDFIGSNKHKGFLTKGMHKEEMRMHGGVKPLLMHDAAGATATANEDGTYTLTIPEAEYNAETDEVTITVTPKDDDPSLGETVENLQLFVGVGGMKEKMKEEMMEETAE